MTTPTGIEAISLALPRRYLDLEDLARARGIAPEKLTVGLGGRRMSVPDPGEDSVSLAATAVARLLAQTGIERERIGQLIVGTESAVDHAKPIASFVQGLLGLPHTMRTYDAQHACYGGTAGLMASAAWIASGAADGQVAIVVAADVARYGVGTAGEPTQGAGAVAMLVSAQPAVLALDLGVCGVSSADVHDFWRPLGRREALVDGHYSIECYLEALAGAYTRWRSRARGRGLLAEGAGSLPSEHLARVLYHVPFCKMARKAHARVRQADLEAIDAAANEAETALSFDRQVKSSLEVCAEVGNVYTASLYVALLGALRRDADALRGRRIGLFSYGSGCCGEFFSGVVGDGAAEALRKVGVEALLEGRERIDVAEYERIMGLPVDPAPWEEPLEGRYRFVGVADGRRRYAGGRGGPQIVRLS